MDITIRLAKSEEIETILELQSEALRILSREDYTEQEIEAIIQTQAKARGHQEIIFIAELDNINQTTNNNIIGFSCLSANSQWIHGIYVHPDRARQKIGTKLLQALEEAAIEKRYRELCVTSSLTAIQFYQANGYKKNFSSRLQLNNRSISVAMMSKQLIPLTGEEKIIRIIVIVAIAIFLLFVFPFPFVVLVILVTLWKFPIDMK